MDLSRPLTDRHEICTRVWCGVTAENLLSKIFLHTLKNWGQSQIIEDRRQSEARNLEAAQHIDKQIITSSSYYFNESKTQLCK